MAWIYKTNGEREGAARELISQGFPPDKAVKLIFILESHGNKMINHCMADGMPESEAERLAYLAYKGEVGGLNESELSEYRELFKQRVRLYFQKKGEIKTA